MVLGLVPVSLVVVVELVIVVVAVSGVSVLSDSVVEVEVVMGGCVVVSEGELNVLAADEVAFPEVAICLVTLRVTRLLLLIQCVCVRLL